MSVFLAISNWNPRPLQKAQTGRRKRLKPGARQRRKLFPGKRFHVTNLFCPLLKPNIMSDPQKMDVVGELRVTGLLCSFPPPGHVD